MRSTGRGQAGALLSLRWHMIRSRRTRIGLAVVGVFFLVLIALVVLAAAGVPLGAVAMSDGSTPLGGGELPTDRTGEVATLLPSAMLAFALLCVLAPVAAGGGYELIPEAELVAYPVKVSTLVRVALALTPLNIAWYLQVLLLSGATAYSLRGPGGPGLPLVVVLSYVLACTTVGQAIGWAIVGVRRTRTGRIATWAALAALILAGLVVIATDQASTLLDSAPTTRVLGAGLRAAAHDAGGWAPTAVVLLVITAAGYLIAVRVAAWSLRQPGDLGIDGPRGRPIRRRSLASDDLRALTRIDRASVWRSPPLRRGLLVLGVLPMGVAALAGLPWSSIALLPPLVGSGAALLFGVNALSLDGSGALWVSTMPQDPNLVLLSKARVVTEVVGGSVLLVLVGASVRASRPPHLLDLVCTLGACVSCVALVVATCMHLSVTRPHRAELRGPRDTPAPPGAMAVYSARLAGVTTSVGIAFSLATFGRSLVIPLVLTAGLLTWATVSWRRTRRIWADSTIRSSVVATVSTG